MAVLQDAGAPCEPAAAIVGWLCLRPHVCRFALGHFDDAQAPRNPFRAIPPSVVGSAEHLALAREAAAKVSCAGGERLAWGG